MLESIQTTPFTSFLSLSSCQPLPHPHHGESQDMTFSRQTTCQSARLNSSQCTLPVQILHRACRMACGTFLPIRGKYYRPGANKFKSSLQLLVCNPQVPSTQTALSHATGIRGKRGTYMYLPATDTGSVYPHPTWPSRQVLSPSPQQRLRNWPH